MRSMAQHSGELSRARYLVVQHKLEGLVETSALEDAVDYVDRDVKRIALRGDGRRLRWEVGSAILEILELRLRFQWRRRDQVRRRVHEGRGGGERGTRRGDWAGGGGRR